EDFRPEAILERDRGTFHLKPEAIKQLFLSRGLAVTHLNNYLEDPRKYYLENLLRQPQPQTLSLMKGNAVHDVLDRAMANFERTGEWMSMSEVNGQLRAALERMPIGEHDLSELHESSLEILNAYLPRLTALADKTSKPEMSFRVSLLTDDNELPE